MTFQPAWQQKISRDGHWQCFWKSQYPIPSLLQSVARQVSRSFSKMVTPSLMRLVISDLDASNACCRSSFQENGVEGLRSARKGDITDAMEKAYATWLTRPAGWRRYVLEMASPPSSSARPFVEVGVDMVTVDLLPAALISTNRIVSSTPISWSGCLRRSSWISASARPMQS